MTYGYVPSPPQQHRRSTTPKIVAGAVGLLLLFLCALGVGTVATGVDDGSGTGDALTVTDSGATSRASAPRTLTPADVTLKVRTKNKSCYGSAGCTVEFSIDATVSGAAEISDECEVTYEVKGLNDQFIATLTIVDEHEFRQDDWQFGGTGSSKDKLTAEATEVRCG